MKKYMWVLILLSLGCSSLKEGEVYEKTYEPELTSFTMIPLVIVADNTTSIIMIPYCITDDEDWIIKVRKFDNEEGEYKYRSFYLTEELYNSLEIGDWFIYDRKQCELKDEDVKIRSDKGV